MNESLRFDSAEHRYFDPNGNELPSVTRILNEEGFYDYSKIPQEILQRAAKFGQAVHRATELWDKGTLDMNSLNPALVPYLNGWIKFKEDYKLEVIGNELKLWSKKYRYAGTLDRTGVCGLGKFAGKLAEIDIKSGLILPGVRLQTAGYQVLHNENFKDKIRVRICVKLIPDGYIVEPLENREDLDYWLNVLSTFNIKKMFGVTTKLKTVYDEGVLENDN